MRRRDRIALILVATVLVVAPFALGGAPRWAICVTSLLSAAGAASFLTSKRELGTLSPLLAFVGLAALLTLLQVIPLPQALVAILSPGKHQLIVDNARALGAETPSWIALSLDPPATVLELAKLCGYVAFAYAALRIAASPARRQWLVSVVALVGAAIALTTLVHLAVGAETLFAIYHPKQAMARPTLAPLLNHNHLSALMALSTPVAVGLAITSAARLRVAWIGVAALCGATGLLAESRGGAIALGLGLGTVAVLTLVQRRPGRQATKLLRSDMVAIAVVALSAMVLLGVLTAGGVVRDLTGTRMSELGQAQSRFGVWRSSSQLLQEFRWTGIGRGSFEMASTRVHDSSTVVFPHVENEYLQAVVDWGFVGAGALALVFIWLATVAARGARSSPWEAGAFAGLAALAVENLTDFSLWMPGVAYPAIALLAVLAVIPAEASSRLERQILRPARAAVIAAVVAAVAVAASPVGDAARDETRELTAWLATRPAPDAAIARAARVFARHPADYASAGTFARALFAMRDQRASAVVNRALALHPTSAELHRLTAQMLLASQQRDQARTEYALALRYRLRIEVLDEVLAAFPSDSDVVRALPLVPALVRELADRLIQRGRTPLALAYLSRYLSLYPDDAGLQLHTAEIAIAVADQPLAARTAQRAYALDPTPAATIVLSQVLARQGQGDQALTLLRQTLDSPRLARPQRAEIHVAIAEVLVSQGALDAARENLRTAVGMAEGRQRAQVHRKVADLEDRVGNKHQAAWERQRAADLER